MNPVLAATTENTVQLAMAVSTRPEMVIFFIVLGFFEKFVKLITSNEINKIIVTKAFNSFNLPHAFHQVIFADYTMLLRVCCVHQRRVGQLFQKDRWDSEGEAVTDRI
jgi:hypothetical protein